MVWNGKNVFTLWGYKPETQLALKWHRRSDGNWRACDRTIDEDVYQANVVFRGPIAELTDLETVLNDKRKEFNATFNDGEEIFGADVDHTGTIPIIVTKYGKIRKADFKVFEMPLTVRMLNPKFKTVSPDFTKLRKATHADTRETEFELSKLFTYDQAGFVIDHLSQDGTEPGTFTAQFAQTKDEMPAIRRYLTLTARATKIPFPTFDGLSFPFGTRAGPGPFQCRVIKWDDLGRQDFCDWNLSITFAREMITWNE